MKRKKSIFFLLAWNDYRIFQGISRYVHEAKWHMDTRHFFLKMLPKGQFADGMITMYHHDPTVRRYIRERAKSIPTVILGTQNPGLHDVPMVKPDNHAAGTLAAEHLYNRFHKNYGWFASDLCPSGKERKEAFEKQVKEFGFSCIDLSCGRSKLNEKTVIGKLRKAPKPLGVMTRDDHDAAVLIDLCEQAGFKTPGDVAVIGVGDIESLCAFSPIPVSSISLNMDELGYRSAAVLDKIMSGRKAPLQTVIQPGAVKERISTAGLAITRPSLKEGVSCIDTVFHKLLTTDDIAAAAGVSRRQLYTIFQSEMRCSPTDYLLGVRLKHARNMISDNHLNLYEIAEATGFNTARTLNRAFHQQFGVSPSQWQKTRNDTT
jgi:LacI family transcriptional regulator